MKGCERVWRNSASKTTRELPFQETLRVPNPCFFGKSKHQNRRCLNPAATRCGRAAIRRRHSGGSAASGSRRGSRRWFRGSRAGGHLETPPPPPPCSPGSCCSSSPAWDSRGSCCIPSLPRGSGCGSGCGCSSSPSFWEGSRGSCCSSSPSWGCRCTRTRSGRPACGHPAAVIPARGDSCCRRGTGCASGLWMVGGSCCPAGSSISIFCLVLRCNLS